MRTITKLMLAATLLVVGVVGAKAKRLSVDLASLPATSEKTTWDSGTNTFAWTDTGYNSTELFGAGNYSAYTTLNLVTTTGTADWFRIIVKFSNGASQVVITPVSTGTISITLSDHVSLENLANVSSIRLSGNNAAAGDITVSSIYLEGPDVNYIEAAEVFEAPAGTTDVKALTGTNTGWNITYPQTLGQAAVLCGDGDGSNESTHVTITDYDYICFNVTSVTEGGQQLRIWVWDDVNSSVVTLYAKPIADYASAKWTEASNVSAVGTYVAKVSDYKYLKGVKTNWGGSATVTVSMAYMSKGSPKAYVPTGKYTLVGETPGSVTCTAALADANAYYYDATGVTGTGVTLNATNPNALFKANAGVLANTKNVIVDGTCANLVLTDGYSFKAPEDFTATAASYTRTLNTAATLCLPFAAKIPEGVTAYTLISGELDAMEPVKAATATEVSTTIPANTPVLLNGSGEKTFTGSGAVKASASNKKDALQGVFQPTVVRQGIPRDQGTTSGANNYVLQNGTKGLGFYLVSVMGSSITVPPFRAYLIMEGTHGNSNAYLDIDYGTTGVNDVRSQKEEVRGEYFDLQGRRVAQPTKGLYIQNGKKVILK